MSEKRAPLSLSRCLFFYNVMNVKIFLIKSLPFIELNECLCLTEEYERK